MNTLGFKAVVYHGDLCLGEVDTIPLKDDNFRFPNNEIRIQYFTSASERCHPLSILQTISSSSPVFCKLEPSSNSSLDRTHLINLHAACFYQAKTAVVLVESEEVHLVAMPSRQKKFPCFWCYSVRPGLYSACLGMLDLRCLAIVFDLDETLLVAHTMKSFEDRIEILRNWIMRDSDMIRSSTMSAEIKRYMEDRALLKQYTDNDCVVDGDGKIYRIQNEEVPILNNGHEIVTRPVIRLPEKNIILTRIKPEIRDTSVIVRLRPAWEDLKSYLTAKGRKRFEVYVCTMAERDYAMEMWRLLDPEARLISLNQQMDRVVCVKSGAKKSLLNVFQGGNCHPKMAMVIDDRLKVWEEKDQPRVHVVPAFSPYVSPQAEVTYAVPVLCVARNVACNVRGGFFKEFDENLLQKISEVHYEDDVVSVPSAPDVSNFLMSEDSCFPSNGSGPSFPGGVNGPEVAPRLKEEKSLSKFSPFDPLSNIVDPKPESSEPVANLSCLPSRSALLFERNNFLGPTIREDTSSSESDHDAKRRFPLVHRGPDIRHQGSIAISPLPRLPEHNFALPAQFQGGWLVEDLNKGQINGQTPALVQGSEAFRNDKQLARQHSHGHGTSTSVAPGLSVQVTQPRIEEANLRPEEHKQNLPLGDQMIGSDGCQNKLGLGSDGSQNKLSGSGRENQSEGSRWNFSPTLSIGVLQEIGRKCNSKVEFRPLVSTCEDLQFSFEVLFSGEKIGSGMGKIRKDAQQQAAENALRNLADKYKSYIGPRSGPAGKEVDRRSPRNENGFIWDMDEPGSHEQPVGNGLLKKKASDS